MENQTKKCQFCGEEIKMDAIKCRFCGEWLNKKEETTNPVNIQGNVVAVKSGGNKKTVQEYKRTCTACGKVWHSLVAREKELTTAVGCSGCQECGSACGDRPALAQFEHNTASRQDVLIKLRTCPNCGSRIYREEIISHEIQ